ncbi:hypothetical protein B0H13DRAFT_2341527 [Mycena leptocephala]|nr:hypothetical protein B0H13DRAFT_2341527 [Mycena leptocephala]
MIDIGCPSHSSRSLPPLYATAMLRRFSAHASFHATALSPPSPLSRASTRNDPRYSYVTSFSCGRCLSVAPLDLHVKIILIPSTSFPAVRRGPAHHQERGPSRGSASALLFLFPLPSLPPAFLPQVQVCVNANDAFVGQIAGPLERARIVARGGEMMMHQCVPILSASSLRCRCVETATGPEERRKIGACMRGRSVDHATNCYGYYVIRKALECKEEEDCLVIVSELFRGDPAPTLAGKACVARAALPCHETGSLVMQNLEESAKDGIVDELLGQVGTVFGEVVKSPRTRSEKHRQMALEHLLPGLLEFATNEQDSQNALTTLKEGRKEMIDRVVQCMCEPAKGARRAMIVDLALSVTRSQLIVSVLLTADKNQRAALYDCIRVHTVTLRGCKTGSKVIWLLYIHPMFLLYPLSCVVSSDRMRGY